MQKHPHFRTLNLHPSITVQGNGVVATQDIQPWTILMSVNKKDVLCCSNISAQFKQFMSIIKNQKYRSQHTQIQRQLQFDNQLLLFYLIYLKNKHKDDHFYQKWFSRPLTSSYYYSRKLIDKIQNYDLLINYIAQHNHLTQLCKFYHEILTQERLKILLNTDQYVSIEQFKQQYQWSYHFVNNRSFGYTSQYTLIPVFDMINHSSLDSNISQILSDYPQPTQNQLRQSLQADESDDNSDNQQDQPSGINQKQKYLKNSQFYYHIYSTQKIRKGQEILIQYGQRNNQFLLEGYGFVEPNNKYDSLVIYLNLDHFRIHFDSVRGQGCQKYKLKKSKFNWKLFIDFKKYYYQKFKQKQNKKCKIIWSMPSNFDFQLFLFNKIVQILNLNRPITHIFDIDQVGSRQLQLYQKQRSAIYQRQLFYYRSVFQWLRNKGQIDQVERLSWPDNLQQYATLLQALMISTFP